MGQTNSTISNSLQNITVETLQEEILRQARHLTPAATCTYAEFQDCLNKLNSLSSHVTSHNGKRLLFAVKKGTDDTLLWRATVRVAVVQMDSACSKVESHRLLTLPQFLRVFSTLEEQMVSALRHSNIEDEALTQSPYVGPSNSLNNEPSSSLDGAAKSKLEVRKALSYSMFMEEVNQVATDNVEKLVECCICLERQPDVILPCAHAFCTSCIEQWNSSHKTCPICRETLETTDDAWVVPDIPASDDVSREICSALMDLSYEPERT